MNRAPRSLLRKIALVAGLATGFASARAEAPSVQVDFGGGLNFYGLPDAAAYAKAVSITNVTNLPGATWYFRLGLQATPRLTLGLSGVWNERGSEMTGFSNGTVTGLKETQIFARLLWLLAPETDTWALGLTGGAGASFEHRETQTLVDGIPRSVTATLFTNASVLLVPGAELHLRIHGQSRAVLGVHLPLRFGALFRFDPEVTLGLSIGFPAGRLKDDVPAPRGPQRKEKSQSTGQEVQGVRTEGPSQSSKADGEGGQGSAKEGDASNAKQSSPPDPGARGGTEGTKETAPDSGREKRP